MTHDGVPEHEEDLATELLLPDGAANPSANGDGHCAIRLRMVKRCPRCPIPNIDPSSAHSTPHVLDCLNTNRQDSRVNGVVSFGMNAIILAGLGRTLHVSQLKALDYGFELGASLKIAIN